MPFLDAALAFALTLFVVATVVTQINRAFFRILSMRKKDFKKMIKEYFEKNIHPVIDREINRLQLEEKISKELDKLKPEINLGEVLKDYNIDDLKDIPTEELIEQLKRTKFGNELLKQIGDKANEVFNELGKCYDMVGNKFTESYRKRSKTWATVVAFILAIILNIDCIFIANTYINNQNIREEVLVQMDNIIEDYESKAEIINSLPDTVEIGDIKESINEVKHQTNVLTASGFPIGYSLFPYSEIFQSKKDTTKTTKKTNIELIKDYRAKDNLWDWLLWGFGIILTGLLAGLGAPFWYDALMGINKVAQKAKSTTKPKKEE